MNQRRVLVVEDDAAIRQGIADALVSRGYAVLEAADGKDGMTAALGAAYDLLLLDLILPGADGLDILRAVRKNRPAVPVIILTARGEEDDRIAGLRLGADDYVVKPFSVRELLARVEAVLRRAPAPSGDLSRIDFKGGAVDLASGAVHFARRRNAVGEATVQLSDREIELLRYLATNVGRPVPREELLARVWGIAAPGIETRTVDMHIVRLREKLRDDAENPRIIVTVRGKGYMFCRR